jgi:hypothetical protein
MAWHAMAKFKTRQGTLGKWEKASRPKVCRWNHMDDLQRCAGNAPLLRLDIQNLTHDVSGVIIAMAMGVSL